jgi:exopolysaccharide production protein ExoQ
MVLLGVSRIGTGTIIMRAMAAFIVASGLVFLVVSAAKTSIGLALLVPALSIFILKVPLVRTGNAVLTALLAGIGLICAIAIMTAFDATLDDLFTLLFGDPTFTGRTSIWAFTWSYVESRPWLGYGFGGFWSTGTAAPVMQTGPWWMKDVINQSHDLYLDLLAQGGVVALVLFLAHVGAMIANGGKLVNWHWADKMSIGSIVSYALIYNLLDTTLFRSFNLDWIYFLAASFLIGLGPLAGRSRGERPAGGSRKSFVQAGREPLA